MTHQRRPLVLAGAVLTAVAITGCGNASTVPPVPSSSPRASHSTPAAAPSSSPAVARHLGPAADVAACRAMDRHGSFSTVAAANKYATFLFSTAARPGVSSRLSGQIERTASDLTAYISGIGSQGQVHRDAVQLQAACAGYGVKG